MAQLYKRPNSPYWWAKFQADGKQYRFSTEKKKRSDAQAALGQKIAEVRGELSADVLAEQLIAAIGKMPSTRQQEFRLALTRRLANGHSSSVALKDAWQFWKESPRSRSPGKNTLSGYKAIFERFCTWAGKQTPPVGHLHDVSPAVAEAYAGDLKAAGVSPRTFNAHMIFLQGMFNALRNRASLAENVWRDIPRREGAPRGRRELKPDEMVKVIQTATGSLRTLFLIGAYTGMRLGDACLLKWENVRLDDGIIEYEPMKTSRKGKRVRIPLSGHLAGWLRGLAASADMGGYVLPDFAAEYRRERSRISKVVQAHFAACEISTQDTTPGRAPRKVTAVSVGFHSLRHSFVSLCAANRVPQVAIMDMVGHGSPAMTRLYSHAGEDQKRQAVDALPALLPRN
jgi:integrase